MRQTRNTLMLKHAVPEFAGSAMTVDRFSKVVFLNFEILPILTKLALRFSADRSDYSDKSHTNENYTHFAIGKFNK